MYRRHDGSVSIYPMAGGFVVMPVSTGAVLLATHSGAGHIVLGDAEK